MVLTEYLQIYDQKHIILLFQSASTVFSSPLTVIFTHLRREEVYILPPCNYGQCSLGIKANWLTFVSNYFCIYALRIGSEFRMCQQCLIISIHTILVHENRGSWNANKGIIPLKITAILIDKLNTLLKQSDCLIVTGAYTSVVWLIAHSKLIRHVWVQWLYCWERNVLLSVRINIYDWW